MRRKPNTRPPPSPALSYWAREWTAVPLRLASRALRPPPEPLVSEERDAWKDYPEV